MGSRHHEVALKMALKAIQRSQHILQETQEMVQGYQPDPKRIRLYATKTTGMPKPSSDMASK